MKRIALPAGLFAALAAITLVPASGLAEEKAPARFTLTFAERFRYESWDNAINLDDASAENYAYTRNKTTLGLRWLAPANLEFAAKVTNEFRVYLAPKDKVFGWHEVFFDNLYAKWRVPGGFPLTVTAGRQDIFLGEGFVIADGTPLDGSRSFYFNAVRLDYDFLPGQKLIFFAHTMNETDRLLPVIHDRGQALVEQPERAVVLYYAGTLNKIKLDAYFIRKSINAPDPDEIRSRISTWGLRAQVPIVAPLVLTAESAAQTGSYGEASRAAFGGIAHLDFTPKWRLPYLKTLTVGGICLTGDDPETAKMEGWDPLFSRWPKWSEGYIYPFIRESRVAYWSNLNSLYGSLAFDFGSRANATLTLHRLGADKAQLGAFPGGLGPERGMLFVSRLNFTISKIFSGHLQWDHFDPGDFYAAGADGFNWIRFELMLRY
ncbi:MAG: hypothetical protein ABFD80_13790 [Acidobacteriota bacterium]